MARLPACILLLATLLPAGAAAHSFDYQVQNRGISARLFSAGDKPVRYSAYEIFGPGDTVAHQKGRTDRNGFVSFLPDRAGQWVIRISGESEHGLHAVEVKVDVNASLDLSSFHKPLVARHTKAFVGGSLILAAFSLWVLLRARKPGKNRD